MVLATYKTCLCPTLDEAVYFSHGSATCWFSSKPWRLSSKLDCGPVSCLPVVSVFCLSAWPKLVSGPAQHPISQAWKRLMACFLWDSWALTGWVPPLHQDISFTSPRQMENVEMNNWLDECSCWSYTSGTYILFKTMLMSPLAEELLAGSVAGGGVVLLQWCSNW